MKKLLILFAALPLMAADCTLQGGAGVYNLSATAASNWTCGSVPAAPNTVTIPSGYTLNVDQDWTIGHSPGANDATAALSMSGPVNVLSGRALTVRGDLKMNNATLTIGENGVGGATVQFDPTQASDPTRAVYRLMPGGANQPNAKVIAYGTPGQHAVLKTYRTSGTQAKARQTTAGYFTRLGLLKAFYLDVSDFGAWSSSTGLEDGTVTAWEYYLANNNDTDEFWCERCTFTSCGPIKQSTNIEANVDVVLRYCKFIDSRGAYPFMSNTGIAKGPTGFREISYCDFDKKVFNSGNLKDFTIDHNIFRRNFTSGAERYSIFRYNIIRDPVNEETNLIGPSIQDTFIIDDHDLFNPHLMIAAATVDQLISGVIMEYAGIQGDGDGIISGGQAVNRTIQYSIMLPNQALSKAGGTMASTASAPQATMSLYHNTFMGGTTAASGVHLNETNATPTGTVPNYKSNLFWDVTARSNHFDVMRLVAVADNMLNPANATNNSAWNAATASEPGKTSNGTYYSVPTTGVAPGANDLNDNPRLVDITRRLEGFDSRYLGFADPAWLPNTAYAAGSYVSSGGVNYRCITAHTSSAADQPGAGGNWRTYWIFAAYDRISDALFAGATYTDGAIHVSSADVIATLLAWIRKGFEPQNPVLKGAGHDGFDIGAVPTHPVQAWAIQ